METWAEPLQAELAELQQQLAQDDVYHKPDYPQLAKRCKELTTLFAYLDQQQVLRRQKDQAQQLTQADDADLVTLAHSEIEQLDDELATLQDKIDAWRSGKKAGDDQRDCLVEIRAGVGGSEAGLFAVDLYRMYIRFAEKQQWRTALISRSDNEQGGVKEIIFEVIGNDVWQKLRLEAGVHRVQRVPTTESQGRIHTSTASVAVLPKTTAQEIDIPATDIKIDTYRASGHGGQSVNKTDSAVRITHLPTKLVVTCQDEKSQFKNKARALEVLRARLHQQQVLEQATQADAQRQQMVGQGERSEKIRTYNFPQDRLTDHRINASFSKLDDILNGDLDKLITKLQASSNDLE